MVYARLILNSVCSRTNTSVAAQGVPALVSDPEGVIPAHSSRPLGALISPPTSPLRLPFHERSSKETYHDPLAEFYPQALKQRQQEDGVSTYFASLHSFSKH